MAEETPPPKAKRPITIRTVVGVLFPGDRKSDGKIRKYGLTMVVVTTLLSMVNGVLKGYQVEMAATQAEARETLRELRKTIPEAVSGLKGELEPMNKSLDYLVNNSSEVRGFIQGRLKCPACICPACPEGRVVRFVSDPRGGK